MIIFLFLNVMSRLIPSWPCGCSFNLCVLCTILFLPKSISCILLCWQNYNYSVSQQNTRFSISGVSFMYITPAVINWWGTHLYLFTWQKIPVQSLSEHNLLIKHHTIVKQSKNKWFILTTSKVLVVSKLECLKHYCLFWYLATLKRLKKYYHIKLISKNRS